MKFEFKKIKNKFLEKIVLNQYFFLYLIIFIFLLIKLNTFVFFQSRFWWDEIVYINLAKFFLTFGNLGFYDSVRPILFPLIIGIFWKLGFNAVLVGKVLVLLSSIGNLILVFLIAEKFKKGSGNIAITLFFTTILFQLSSNYILTEALSCFFVLFSVYLSLKNKFFLSGFFISLAFLTRFFLGIFLPIISLWIIIKFIKNQYKERSSLNEVILHFSKLKNLFKELIKPLFKKGFSLFLGFIIPTGIYLLLTYLFLGDPFITIKKASLIISDYGLFLYSQNYFYYFKYLFIENLLILFLFLFLYFYFRKKFYKKENYSEILILSVLLPLFYLSLSLHKEDRYIFVVIPFLCILSSFVLMEISQLLSILLRKITKFQVKQKTIVMCFIVLIITLTFVQTFSQGGNLEENYSERELEVLKSLEKKDIILTNEIAFSMFNSNKMYILPSWEAFFENLEFSKNTINKVIIKDCNLFCSFNFTCPEKDTALNYLEENSINIYKMKNLSPYYKQLDNGSSQKVMCNIVTYELK